MALSLVIERILATAGRERGRAAIIFEGRIVTYAQLLALISNAARLFRGLAEWCQVRSSDRYGENDH